MQRHGLRRERGVQDQSRQPLEDLAQARALEDRNARWGTQALDDAMDDCAEERRLVRVAMIEGSLRDACPTRDGFDARGAIAMREEKLRGNVQKALAEFLRLCMRRAAA